MHGFRRYGRALSAALLLLGVASCVTEVESVKPLAETALVVSRSGDRAVLQFDTQTGRIYQVVYAPRRETGMQWKVLPGAENVVGNGMRMQFVDRVPYGQERYYRIRIKAMVR